MTQRRILLLVTDLKIGGTPRVVRELAVRLHRPPEVVVDVACLAPWGAVADEIRARQVRVTELGASGPGDFRVVRRLRRLIDIGNYDTVFSFLVHANAAAAVAVRGRDGVRLIESIQTTQRRPRWHWTVQRVAQLAADVVVVPSPSVAAVARNWADVPEERIVVIPNAVDVEAFEAIRAARMGRLLGRGRSGDSDFVGSARRAVFSAGRATVRGADPTGIESESGSQSEDRPTRIGFIGRLDPIKRVSDLVAAVALLDRSVRLEIFGEGSDRAAIEAAIARHGVGDRVTLHGAISSAALGLEQIDLLVLPSQAEGFGLVLIEAMAAGVPVVACDVPGVRDVVRSEQTGLLVPPGDPVALARAIGRILSDSGLEARLTAAAYEDVKARFGWPGVMQKYRAILRLDEAVVDQG